MAEKRLDRHQVNTPWQDVNAIINLFVDRLLEILKENIGGIYLTGSLSYGDFNENSSDIDLAVFLKKAVSSNELNQVKKFHVQLEKDNEKLAKRLECSYTPLEMLSNILPPVKPRPWYCGFESYLYEEAPYGNEWIINNYLLYHHAIPLFGPDIKEWIQPIDILEVQKACIRDLFVEWEPKISNLSYLNDSHNQSYLILNLCRILYTVLNNATGSKRISADWVKREFGLPWKSLIELAQGWQYGMKMEEHDRTIEFSKFTVNEIIRTNLFLKMKNAIEPIRAQNN